MAILHPSIPMITADSSQEAVETADGAEVRTTTPGPGDDRSDRWPAPLQLIDREWFRRHAASVAAGRSSDSRG
jgi:hypothetical protein